MGHSVAAVIGRRRRADDGMVTAEAAVTLPVVAIFVLALVWLLSVGVAQVRTVDAARDAARAIARGDDPDAAVDAAERTAPDSAQVSFSEGNGTVTVTVSTDARAPGWLLVPLPAIHVGSSSTVDVEGADDD
ncbi:MAG: TadE family type IV pilus minor pilin [Nocardioidaceae bacterium]